MATRTNDLTKFAKPIADSLTKRCGTLKQILSAGVIALGDMTPEKRERYMARAAGETVTPESDAMPSEAEIYAELEQLAALWRSVNEKIQRIDPASKTVQPPKRHRVKG